MFKRVFCFLICFAVSIAVPFSAFAVEVSAESAILIECNSGDIVYEKNAYAKMPMASTTKIMTGLLAVESGRLDETVTVTDGMVGAEGSSIYLKVGEKLTLRDLVYALMLQSANDAAEAIAVYLSGSIENFAQKMNEKAVSMGLENTSFVNPHGLDDDAHYTTAYDLARITVCALENDIFREIVSTYRYTVEATEIYPARFLVNHNRLLAEYEGAIGVKTGFTKKCGRCLVSAAERDGVRLVAVTLADPDDWNDHKAMLDLGFSIYKSVCIADVGELRFEIPVISGDTNSVFVSNMDKLDIVMDKDKSAVECKVEALLGQYAFAPIEKGAHMADAVFFLDGQEIARLPLYAEADVALIEEDKGFFDIFD